MQTYDLIMLAVLVGATLLGAWQGMAWQVASFASVVLSYLVACTFREFVAELIPAGPPWDRPLAMLILFVGTSLVIWIVFQIVSRFIDRLKLKEFDRQVGAVIGLAKGVILCVVVTLFAVALVDNTRRQAIIDSYSGYCIAEVINQADPFIPAEVQEVLDAALDPRAEQPDPALPEVFEGIVPPDSEPPAWPLPVDVWSAEQPQPDEGSWR
jgi:membrane protein required for colicin V production